MSDNPFAASRLNAGSDFRPDWDVPTLNRRITDYLTKAIRAVKGQTQPAPDQMLQVLLAPPGYGKTHLFGRIGHELDDEVLFVFVPAFEDISRPLEHIRWHAVESLFRERAGRPPALHQALARLSQPSFVEYVSQFPPSQAARHEHLLRGLQEGTEAVLALVQAVSPLGPFLRLASSVAARFTDVSGSVIRALALGWSPAGNLARRWLRGESLPEADLATLGFPADADPPGPLDVLSAITAVFQYQLPLVICCDQIEMVLKDPNGPKQVTAQLIEVLHRVPGQVVVLSCLQTEWPAFLDRSFLAFQQRAAKPCRLSDLSESQAVDLVGRRIASWDGRNLQREATWPFDEAAIRSYVRDHSQNPRLLIQRCAELFAEWSESDRLKLLYLTRSRDVLDPAKVFLQAWNEELEKITKDPNVAWSEYQEERLYRGIQEVLTLTRDAGREVGDVRIRNVAEGGLRQRGKIPRRALTVDVATAGQDYRVIVPVTTLDNGRNFRFYFEDIEAALAEPVAGCLLVHRQEEFSRGGETAARFDALLGTRLRLFTLEENPPTLHRLECLLRFLDRAVGQELVIDNVTLSYKDCQDFVLKTSVLDSLDLLNSLTAWRKVQPAVRAKPVRAEPIVATAGIHEAPARVPATPAVAVPRRGPKSGPAASALEASVSPAETAPPKEPTGPKGGSQRDRALETVAWAHDKLGVLVEKLRLFGVPVNPAGVEVGPSFARLKIQPANRQARFNRIRDQAIDLKIHLGLDTPPIIESQPNYISVDVELPVRQTVRLAEVQSEPPRGSHDRPIFPVGIDVSGKAHWLDLADAADCHILVAGQTGSGKSEFLRCLLAALAIRLAPEQLQFVLIDPKRVTFNLGKLESPYLRTAVAHEAEQTVPALEWCVSETQRRYELLEAKKKTNVGELEDQTVLPRVVIVVDEFADLLTDKETKPVLTGLFKRIGAIARAAGIHLVLATQRPDKDVVTPQLKNNLPGRIALRVTNEANSKLIIGDPSAAYLLGKGDLYWQHGGKPLRLQSPFVTQAELEQALRAH